MNQKSLYRLGLGLLGVIGLYFVMAMPIQNNRLRRTEPYQETVQHVLEDERVVNLMGSPVKVGRFVTGDFRSNDFSGSTYLKIPIDGSERKGVVHTFASREGDEWQYEFSVLLTPHCGNGRSARDGNDLYSLEFALGDSPMGESQTGGIMIVGNSGISAGDESVFGAGEDTVTVRRDGENIVYSGRELSQIMFRAALANQGESPSDAFCR